MSAFDPLLRVDQAGLYSPVGDFHIDPMRPVRRAVITHGHADHARAGHDMVLATAETLAIMEARFGRTFAGRTQAIAYGERVTIDGAAVSVHPAGHVLGSAQIAIRHRGRTAVVTGDYKRRADPTCPAFEPVPCDLFVSEATFGLPIYRHPPIGAEIDRLVRSMTLFPERTHVVGAYSLGKAQRVIAELRRAGYDQPIGLARPMVALCAIYEHFGVTLGPLVPLDRFGPLDWRGALVLAPPGADLPPEADAAGSAIRAFASGWARVRGRRARAQGELPLVISDHADWDELLATCREVAREAVWIMHGDAAALGHVLSAGGLDTRALARGAGP